MRKRQAQPQRLRLRLLVELLALGALGGLRVVIGNKNTAALAPGTIDAVRLAA